MEKGNVNGPYDSLSDDAQGAYNSNDYGNITTGSLVGQSDGTAIVWPNDLNLAADDNRGQKKEKASRQVNSFYVPVDEGSPDSQCKKRGPSGM